MNRIVKILMVLVLPLMLFSQVLTTASISGKATGTDNKPLAFANIIAEHIPTGTVFGTVSRDDGYFDIPNLRIGPYTVTISYIGYKTEITSGITLSLGQNLRLNYSLAEETLELAGIEVVADARSAQTGQSTNISEEQIELMPTVQRGLYDMAKLAANVNGNEIAGKHPSYNTVKIDGAVLNDVFGLASNGLPGGQAGTQPISLDAIQEIQILIAPYDVRHSGFAGGALNAITRSGSNKMEGSVYSYMRNESLIGKFEDNEYPEFTESVYGARLGGAIIPDKLHYFLSAEISKNVSPNTITLEPDQAQSFNGTKEEVERVDDILTNVYGIDTGGTDPFDATTANTKILAKIDYIISDKHRLSLRHNFVDATDDIIARSVYNFRLGNAGYVFNSKQNSTMLHLYSSLANNMSNTFTVGYTTIRDFRDEQNPNVPSFRIGGSSYTNIYGGAEQYSVGNLLDQDIIQISNNFSYFKGNHAISVGTHNELYSISNGFFRNFNGYYRFDDVDDFEDGIIKEYQLTYSAVEGDPQPLAAWKANIFGFHAQDIWNVNDQLRLTFGTRIDVPMFPEVPLANDVFAEAFGDQGIKTDQMPGGNLHISPRFGFNYKTMDESETLLRGGIGVFSGVPKFVWLSNNYSLSGMMLKTIYAPYPDSDVIMDLDGQYEAFIDLDAGYQKSEIDVIDKDLMFPQVLRTNLAIDRKLPFGLNGTIEMLYGKDLNEITYQQINAKEDVRMADGRKHYNKYDVSSNFYEVMYITNTNKGYQYSITGKIDGNWTTDLGHTAAGVSYTYSQSKSVNSLTSSQAKSNWRYNPIGVDTNDPQLASSLYEIPHRIVGTLSQSIELLKGSPTTFSLFYEGKSGGPYTYIYDTNSDYNNDGSKDNDILFVYDDASKVNIVDGDGNDAWTAWETFVNDDEFLSAQKGKMFERNSAREPWSNRLDLRISQKIGTPIGKNIDLTVDILNFANLLNKDWGQVEYVSYGTYRLLEWDSHSLDDDAAGIPTFEFEAPETVLSTADFGSRWQILVGLRFNF